MDADDLFKKAGGFFGKLGGSIKSTTKQVTGLGRGSVKLELDGTKFTPGATVRGRVVLALSEPVSAKRLVARLYARQKVMNVHRSSSGRTVSTSHNDVYDFEAELAGERAFESGTFSFELVIPPDALEMRPKESAGASPLADAVRTVASALSPSAGPIEWQVIGRLVIPWGRDLRDDVDIVVAR